MIKIFAKTSSTNISCHNSLNYIISCSCFPHFLGYKRPGKKELKNQKFARREKKKNFLKFIRKMIEDFSICLLTKRITLTKVKIKETRDRGNKRGV